jgi:1-acyl-sn-glycerol-3-phosphate acyltransferase
VSRSEPTTEELAVLTPLERFAFRVSHKMNAGRWKALWSKCQRVIGVGWIDLSTYNIMEIYGLDNVTSIRRTRPILLVANHRSFFDFYAVSAMLLKKTDFIEELYFPVRGRFFYQSVPGMFVNLVMGFWSMYPPVFKEGDKRRFNEYSNRRLMEICSTGTNTVIGFHPEGTRNQSPDPYSFLPAQPGVGQIIKSTAPHVVPVFVAGLSNDLPKQVLGNWTGGPKIRIYFGPEIDFSAELAMKNHVRTYKAIADKTMQKVAELTALDRARYPDAQKGAMGR